jgi:hypothetical protein
MKRIAFWLMGALLVFGLIGCTATQPKEEADISEAASDAKAAADAAAAAKEAEPEPAEPELDIDAQLGNPLAPAADADEVFKVTDIKVVLHNDEAIGFEVGNVAWSTIGQNIAQAVFWAKDMNGVMPMGEATITLRAMATEKPEDISGVYDTYDKTTTETYTTSSGTSVAVEIRSTEGVGAVAIWYNPDTKTSWSASFSEFSTDYMTTEAVMKYLVEDTINLN